jgi:hypothetical protein
VRLVESLGNTYVTYSWIGRDQIAFATPHEGGEVVKFWMVCQITFSICFRGVSINRGRRDVVLTSKIGFGRFGIDGCWGGETNENEGRQGDESKEFAEGHIDGGCKLNKSVIGVEMSCLKLKEVCV